MTRVVSLHDRGELEVFLRRDPFGHLFALADLDDRFWPYTAWYGLDDGGLCAVVLVYFNAPRPVVMAVCRDEEAEAMAGLLVAAAKVLPRRAYAHLSPGTAAALAGAFAVHPRGRVLKMGLTDPARPAAVDAPDAELLTAADLAEVERFYREAYPSGGFHPGALDAGPYFGVRVDGALAGVAGVHAHSAAYRVAALGNVATHPSFRRRGIATRTTARVCQALAPCTDHVGLVVRADSTDAIACYERLGFTAHSTVETCDLEVL